MEDGKRINMQTAKVKTKDLAAARKSNAVPQRARHQGWVDSNWKKPVALASNLLAIRLKLSKLPLSRQNQSTGYPELGNSAVRY